MISCRSCEKLQNNDPDGMVLTCSATGHKCFIDDLPFTTMKNCPKVKNNQNSKIKNAIKHFESLQKRYTTQHNGVQCEFVKTALVVLYSFENSSQL